MRSPPLLAVALTLFAVQDARAQDPTPDEAEARASSALACLGPVQSQLTTHVRLLREAKQQLESRDAAVRADAARAVISLEQRLDDLGEALRACVPRSARLEPRVEVHERTGAEANVAERNAATQVVERDVALRRLVHVVVGERVDGRGNAPPDAVRRSVREVAGRLEQCYESFLERGALQTGTAILSFTVTGNGRVERTTVEQNTLRDTRFASCLRSAAGHMRIQSGASGGDARYAYTLRFGTSQ